MERAGEILRRPMNDQCETPKPSAEFSAALKQNLALFGEIFHQEITPLAVVGYLEALRDLSIEQLNRGCALALRNCKFMPRPAEIREHAQLPAPERGDVLSGADELGCDLCRWTGWRLVPKLNGGEHVRLCECTRRKRATDKG
jgi:hypothetical protein